MIFQYQSWVEPLAPEGDAPRLAWLPTFPDRVARTRPPFSTGVFQGEPIAPPPIAVDCWTPSFPDRVARSWIPRGDASPAGALFVPFTVTVGGWTPSFPDQLRRPLRLPLPSYFAPDPNAPNAIPGRWAPRGPIFAILEGASGRHQTTVVGHDGVTPLPGATLTALQLTLYVIRVDDSDVVVNGRLRQNVLNTNDVVVLPDGRIIWTIQPADTLVVTGVPFERHIALFEWEWPGGRGKREVIFVVQNLRRVN
jgi:hypothetical protein